MLPREWDTNGHSQVITGGPRMSASTSASAAPRDSSCLTTSTKQKLDTLPSGITSGTQLTSNRTSSQGQTTQTLTRIPSSRTSSQNSDVCVQTVTPTSVSCMRMAPFLTTPESRSTVQPSFSRRSHGLPSQNSPKVNYSICVRHGKRQRSIKRVSSLLSTRRGSSNYQSMKAKSNEITLSGTERPRLSQLIKEQ
jgi:hypothetical protein